VSRRLRAMERDVDMRFVENVSGRLMLTAQGERAVEAARSMREHTDDLMRDLVGRDPEVRGLIRVGLLEIFVRDYADAFASFSLAHPQVQLELLSQGARLHSLNQRDADVVLRATRSPHETLVGRPLFTVRYAPFAHPDMVQEEFKPDELRWIGWHEEMRAVATEQWLHEHAGVDQIAVRVTSTSSMVDLARASLGACILPVKSGERAGLTRLDEPLDGFDSQIWMLTHRDLASSARVRAFMKHLGDYFSR